MVGTILPYPPYAGGVWATLLLTLTSMCSVGSLRRVLACLPYKSKALPRSARRVGTAVSSPPNTSQIMGGEELPRRVVLAVVDLLDGWAIKRNRVHTVFFDKCSICTWWFCCNHSWWGRYSRTHPTKAKHCLGLLGGWRV